MQDFIQDINDIIYLIILILMDYLIPINDSEIVPQRTINLSAFSIQFSSSDIQIASSKKGSPLSNSKMKQGCRLGMDSHADMTCVSRHAKIIE